MKRYLIFCLFISGIISSVYCSNDTAISKIIIFRESNLNGSLNAYKIYANDSLIVNLKNNSYFSFDCRTGIYKLKINRDNKTELEVKAEKGRTYYIRFGLQSGFLSNTAELMPMDSAYASRKIILSGLKKVDRSTVSDFYYRNRIGVNLGIGFGFENFKMFTINSPDSFSKISFGGGYSIGINYARELNKHLDISLAVNYQFSLLIPYINNATTTFRRGAVSITPAYLILLDANNNKKFRLGIGYDFYFDNHLIINGSKVPLCFDAVWIYKTAHGFHVSATYNMTLFDRLNLDYGLKYYYVYYSFDSGYHEQSLGNMLKPNGSGLDFVLGISYKF
ncbi:MAG: DUF2846 domain-containing protein [Bacteroidetes bacterium]|nr:DUF2846 domain-containing protein [Bacteroidota bacterium]